MGTFYPSKENNSKESTVNASSSPTESPESAVELPTAPSSKEVANGNEAPDAHNVEQPAQAEVLESSNVLTVPVESLGSSSDPPQRSPPDFTEHHEELMAPVGRSVSLEMMSNSVLAQVLENSIKDKATDHSSPADTIEVSNMPVNVSTSAETMLTAEMKSKEDKIDDQGNIAVTPKKAAESETKPERPYSGLVDTAAPFESVREAVTKFGGIVDWKAHKAQILERHKLIKLQLEKFQKEIPQCKEELEAAEMAKSQVLEELESTKRLVEELKHDLERAQIEEAQAKQDSELAQLRAQEMEQGIADEASVIARTQFEVAKERHEKAVAELKLVKDELRSVHGQYITLVNERDIAIKRAAEVISAKEEIEKRVEELTFNLIASKESLELAHAAHHEAEEHRIGAALAKEQDFLAWDKELQQAQEQLQQVNKQLLAKNDVMSNLDAKLRKLLSLKSELVAYMENRLCEELASYMENQLSEEAEGVVKGHDSNGATQISRPIKETLASTGKELEEVKGNIEKSKTDTSLLKIAATSLRSDLDNEKASLVTLQQREGMASITVCSLEAQLNKTKQEIESVRSTEAEAQEKMVELPKMLQQAAQEAEYAKWAAQSAQEELRKAKEEAEYSKAAATTAEIKLHAVLKETEACKASERLALAAVQALQESEEARSVEDSPRRVTLPIEEYYALTKKVHEAEELANERVTAALAQVKLAKESESRMLERLNEASEGMDEKKEALETALEKDERAKEGKLGAEQELRKWRAEHEQHRKSQEAVKHAVNPLSSPLRRYVEQNGPYQKEPLAGSKFQKSSSTQEDLVSKRKLRRKKSFFVLMATLLSRKAQAQT